MKTKIDFTRIKSDVNGNARYVCHFLNIPMTKSELLEFNKKGAPSIECHYQEALNKAKKIGGKKFHNKQYGGGIVFQSYSGCLPNLEKLILAL